MDFRLSDEQEMLRDGLNKFLATRYGLERSRATAKTGAGWQPDIWRAFAIDLGILGAALPEEVGGIGGGPVEIMVIAEALGHALVVEPYVDTAVVAAGLLLRAGGARAVNVLERIASERRSSPWPLPKNSRATAGSTSPPPHAATGRTGCSQAPRSWSSRRRWRLIC